MNEPLVVQRETQIAAIRLNRLNGHREETD